MRILLTFEKRGHPLSDRSCQVSIYCLYYSSYYCSGVEVEAEVGEAGVCVQVRLFILLLDEREIS